MLAAMILAHLIGDFILQWNKLAAWKARELKGVVVHVLIVSLVTLSIAVTVDPTWLPWAIFICVMHLVIDAAGLRFRGRYSPLGWFAVDQTAHFTTIFLALFASQSLDLSLLTGNLLAGLESETLMLYLIGYAFVTMPAWVLVKFTAYGLVGGMAPEFGHNDKYPGMIERLLIVTFVGLGQFYLVPLVMLPRFLVDWPRVADGERTGIYLAELLVSVFLAVFIGLMFWLV